MEDFAPHCVQDFILSLFLDAKSSPALLWLLSRLSVWTRLHIEGFLPCSRAVFPSALVSMAEVGDGSSCCGRKSTGNVQYDTTRVAAWLAAAAADGNTLAAVSFLPPTTLSSETPRTGCRPTTNPCLPHSQTSQNSPDDIWETFRERIHRQFSSRCTFGRSHVSLPTSEALHIVEGVPVSHPLVEREFAHLHAKGEGSMHLVLSPLDAKVLIDAQWGEFHLLAGAKAFGSASKPLPIGLVMLYAPRTMEEIDICMEVLEASYKYATSNGAL